MAPHDLQGAADWLRRGGIVAFPTDTFYGLAVDPRSAQAVGALYELKGRPGSSALPFVAASRDQVEALCGRLDRRSAALADAFWPGPLSLVLDAPSAFAPDVLAGQRSIAIRVPAMRVARVLCEVWGSPLPATSANRSGEPPAATAAALEALAADTRVCVVDGGTTAGGRPSTIVDVRGAAPVLIREGAIAWSRVLRSFEA